MIIGTWLPLTDYTDYTCTCSIIIVHSTRILDINYSQLTQVNKHPINKILQVNNNLHHIIYKILFLEAVIIWFKWMSSELCVYM